MLNIAMAGLIKEVTPQGCSPGTQFAKSRLELE